MPHYTGTINAQHPKAGQYIKSGFFNGLSSFPELVEKISRLPETVDKGAAFEVFAEAYLATRRQNDFKRIWPLEAVPKSVREKLGIRLEDFGIDGVCLNHLGTYDVYQIKFRSDPLAVLNWGDVSTFYGLADAPAIESKILFSNCADVVSVIKERKNSVFILSAQLEELGTEDFRQIAAWLEGGKIEIPKKQLRDDQLDAVNALTLELSQADRASCIMACGTGKTFVALKTLEARWAKGESQKTVVFVPSLALLSQILDDWRKDGAVFKSLCVCSDRTVDDDINQADCGFRVTIEASVVRRFLDSAADLPKIVFSTYQSSPVIKEALAIKGDSFDLAIFDEAHRTAGREGRAYSLALSDEHIRVTKRLFFTATPRHCSVAQQTVEGEFKQLYSMDDPAVYGRQVHTLSVRKAIELDIIVPYKVLISVVTSDEVHHELLKRGETLVRNTDVRARQVANQIALRDAIQQHGIKKIFTFHSRVASAESFVSKEDEGIGTHLDGFVCDSVNGTMSAKVRGDILKDFKGADQAILSNARCLTEGVNVPSVDCVGLFAPLKSRVSAAQAIGRAMRKMDGKEFGYILVPVYLESDEDLDTAARRSKFDVVLDVLQTLKEQDEALAEELRQIVARKVEGHDDTIGLQDVIFRKPAIAPNVPLEDLMDAIRVQCIDALLNDWELLWQEKYQKTLTRHKEKGDCNASRSEDSELCRWQCKQRVRYNQGKLAPDLMKLLNHIPTWTWDLHETLWQEQYQKTLTRHKEKGDCNATQPEDRELYAWQKNQRDKHKKGWLTPDRVKLLSDIPTWDWDPRVEAFWQEKYQKTLSRREEKGDCNATQSEDLELYRWQQRQRALYKKSRLAPYRVKLLSDLPTWVWDADEAFWQEQYQKTLRRYKEKGDCNTSRSEDSELYAWQLNQRRPHKKARLTPDRMKLLNDIPTWGWDPRIETFWQEKYQKTLYRYEEEGNCNASIGEDRELAKWQIHQRMRYNQGKLAPDRAKLLSDIPTWTWDPLETLWQEKYQKTLRRHEEKGDCNVPEAEDSELMWWQIHQRGLHKKARLAPDRVKLLNDIPTWNWGKRFGSTGKGPAALRKAA